MSARGLYVLVFLVTLGCVGWASPKPVAAAASLFSVEEPLPLQLEAPLNDLFDHARTAEDDYSVAGTLSYTHDGRDVSIEGVTVSLRGNTSRRENECAFPKLKVQLPAEAGAGGPLLAGVKSLKIGTHCGEAADEALTVKYGRMPNEHSPVREAFIYRLLAAVGVPTLNVRQARISYVYTDPKPDQSPDQSRPVVRSAILLEDVDDAVRRFDGTHEIKEEAFTTARAQFSNSDTARLAFAEAMIGNFDWCLKMEPTDTYRCNARHPLWNIIAAASADGKATPLLYDFDVSGMVVGTHPWSKTVFNPAFSSPRSETAVKVIAQVQRTRTLFDRAELDRTRAYFMQRKDAAYHTLDTARIDDAGRQNAKAYLDTFYDAIGSDEAFYRPVVAAAGAKLYGDENRTPICASLGAIPVGTPVSDPLQKKGGLIEVVVLDALWHWAPPAKCPAVQDGTVWINADVVSREYPDAPGRQ